MNPSSKENVNQNSFEISFDSVSIVKIKAHHHCQYKRKSLTTNAGGVWEKGNLMRHWSMLQTGAAAMEINGENAQYV